MMMPFLCIVHIGLLATQQLQGFRLVLVAAMISCAVRVMAQRPVGKLVKEHIPSTVHVNLFEGCIQVSSCFQSDSFATHLLEYVHGGLELGQRHSAIMTCVHFLKPLPELQVVPDVREQQPELVPIDVVIAEVCYRRSDIPRSLKRSVHNCLRNDTLAKQLNHSLVYFCERKDAVGVRVPSRPQGVPFRSRVLVPANRELLVQLLGVDGLVAGFAALPCCRCTGGRTWV
mmetsp:Transcript_41600/g.93409  ORF Transcript_41600/g.93409 Transcript_41600/m.93409 type:complete len:229 (-) Transcript_41600:484-1170(-)